MNKIIFITDSIEDPRIDKRKKLFEANGFKIEIFAFIRVERPLNSDKLYYEKIGNIGTLPYHKRLYILYKGIKKVIKRYKNEDVTFYLFGLQIATIYRFLSNNPYIYEEADLVHTNLKFTLLKKWFELIDKSIIKDSELTVFTSEGFIQYHFQTQSYNNCIVIGNKLMPQIQLLNSVPKSHKYNQDNIQFGFVGSVRYDSTFCFIEHVVKKYPEHIFHIFGIIAPKYDSRFKALNSYNNLKLHGSFKNPTELPNIYSKIDYVLSTYDIEIDNVKYLEPNKLYESIYFRTPIIVSENTFLATKVKKLGIGLAVNCLSKGNIDKLIKSLSSTKYNELLFSLNQLDKSFAVDSYIELTQYLKKC